jgi:cell division protein FtsB
VRRWLPAAVFALIALAYSKPVQSYFETRGALAGRVAEVRALERERAGLQRRLAASKSEARLAREARRIGYVKPGETLFIVKGIRSWREHRDAGAARPPGHP